MPFKSKAQARFMESKDSPLTDSQKKEWSGATDFSKLKEHVQNKMHESLRRTEEPKKETKDESKNTKDTDDKKSSKSKATASKSPNSRGSDFLHSVASKMIAARKK